MTLERVYAVNKSAVSLCESGRGVARPRSWETKSMSTDTPKSDSSDVDIECPTCGRDDFSSRKGMKIHHGRVHDESIAGFEKTCPVCGDTFWAERQDRYETCGPECGGALQSERMLGTDILTSKAELQERYVDQRMTMQDIAEEARCGRTTVYNALKRHDIPTRSRSGSGEDNNSWKGGKEVRICTQCGDEFETWPSDNEKRCSRECYAEFRQGRFVGEDCPAYKGGEYAYGEGFAEPKKEAVRERDGHQCQSCGMTQEQHLEQHKQKLHVHHIMKARFFDDAEPRNDDANLVAMCVTWHGEWEGIPLRPQTTTKT